MTGWTCPRCLRCYSPFTEMCLFCGPSQTSSSMTGTVAELNRSGTVAALTCRHCGRAADKPPATGCPIGFHYGTFAGTVRWPGYEAWADVPKTPQEEG